MFISMLYRNGEDEACLCLSTGYYPDLSDLSISAERVFSCIFVGVYDGRISVRYSIGNTIHSVLEEEIQTEYVLLYFQ